MGGGLSATAAALLHARPGTGAGAAGFLSSPPLPASRPPSGLGDPWLPGPPSRPLSPPTSSARWSAAERRAAVQGGVGGATAVLALAALVLLAGRAAPPSALASPRSFLTASAAQGKELGLWGGASEGRGGTGPNHAPHPPNPAPHPRFLRFLRKGCRPGRQPRLFHRGRHGRCRRARRGGRWDKRGNPNAPRGLCPVHLRPRLHPLRRPGAGPRPPPRPAAPGPHPHRRLGAGGPDPAAPGGK